MPYSVSPRVRDQIVGPKPTKYWVAFIPNRLAVMKCPDSWSMSVASSAITNAITPIRVKSEFMRRPVGPGRVRDVPRAGSRQLAHPRTRPGVGREHIVERHPRVQNVVFGHYPPNGVHYSQKWQSSVPEGLDALLVRRVVHRGRGAAERADVPGQLD